MAEAEHQKCGTEGWGLRTMAPQLLGVEYQWIDMLIYGVLMMTHILMAMDVDNDGEHQAPSKSGCIQGGVWEPSPCGIRQWYGRWSIRIDSCEGRGVGVGWGEGEWLVVVDDW